MTKRIESILRDLLRRQKNCIGLRVWSETKEVAKTKKEILEALAGEGEK